MLENNFITPKGKFILLCHTSDIRADITLFEKIIMSIKIICN